MSLLKTNEIQNYNGSSLTLTASTVSTSAQLNTGGNISVTGSLNVSDDSTTRTNLGLGTIATQDSDSITVTGGTATLGALTVSGSDSGDLVRITQTGSGNALVVEDSTNPDSTPVVVDTAGRLLVGSTTARSSDITPVLQTEGVGAIGNSAIGIFLNRDGDASGPRFIFTRTRGTVAGSSVAVANNDSLGRIVWNGADGTDTESIGGIIECYVDGTPGTNDMPGRLVFSTTADGASSPTERMWIDSSGRVGIGNNLPSSALDVRSANDIQIEIENTGGGGGFIGVDSSNVMNIGRTGPVDLAFKTNNTERMRIDSSGNVKINNLSASSDVQTDASKNLITTSDARLKNEIGLIDESGIEVIKQIIPKYFSWKNDENNNQQLGFFAQDIYPVLPEAAPRVLKYTEVGRDENDEPILEQVFDENGNPDYEWGFTDRPIIAMCVKGIQEQQSLIESQQSQIDALTARIVDLETT